MRSSWFWTLVLAGVLAGCNGGGQSPLSPSGAAQSRASWIVPNVGADHRRKSRLVYISSFYSSIVDIYGWESTTRKDVLTGFSDPQGMCTGNGRVWIANTDGSNLPEYAAGGTSEIGSLSDAGYFPIDCAFDPTTGNVAVSNIFGTGDSNGNVVIFSKASGSGTAYTLPNIAEPFFVAYDGSGNLFADGHPTLFGSGFGFAELVAGSSSFRAVTLNKAIGFPGELQWDGSYLALQDEDSYGIIDRFKIARFKGRLEGTVAVSECAGWYIERSTLVCDALTGDDLYYYAYPAGGTPIKTEAVSGLEDASGVIVVKYKR